MLEKLLLRIEWVNLKLYKEFLLIFSTFTMNISEKDIWDIERRILLIERYINRVK